MKYSYDNSDFIFPLNYRNLLKQGLYFLFIFLFTHFQSLGNNGERKALVVPAHLPGANAFQAYLPQLKNKRVAIVGNHSSLVYDTMWNHVHLLDTLLNLDVNVVKLFSPEHGFRGDADAGAKVDNSTDVKSGLPIISLYGKHKKPTSTDLNRVDIILFDLQDVGVRFYTYISTLHYVMEAAAENNLPVIVLDRGNPNDDYVDGPVLEKEFTSFVGMHPVPVVYGMTIGEYAKMINGEGWLKNQIKCNLEVISSVNYKRAIHAVPMVAPSPNLKSYYAMRAYPSLCLFEGTIVSVGRGTDTPFEVYGHPRLPDSLWYQFKPRPNKGAKHPKLEGEHCHGEQVAHRLFKSKKFDLTYLYKANEWLSGSNWVNSPSFFDRLAGTNRIRIMLLNGSSVQEIEATWQTDLDAFKLIREKYLLYE